MIQSQPPITRTTHTLSFDKLSPRDFERLCLWLVKREGYERAEHLGAAGSEQGRDIVVERTRPYVSANGTVQFSHSSYQQAILTIIAQSYREYFLELLPVFERKTIPTEDTLHSLKESYDLRVAVAVALGEVGKERLDDIIPLLEEWAAHPDARVRGAVGIALSQVVQNRTRVRPTLRLLHDWARDFSDGYFKRWTAAAALWRIGQIDLDLALPELSRLTGDSHERVRAAVAYGAIRLGRKNAEEMAPVVQSLGGDEDQYVRLQAADAVRAMWRRDRAIVADIPLLTTALTGGLLIFAVRAWRHRYWTAVGRVHYSLVALAALTFTWFLCYWGLLGLRL